MGNAGGRSFSLDLSLYKFPPYPASEKKKKCSSSRPSPNYRTQTNPLCSLCRRDQGLWVIPRPPSCIVPSSAPAERAPPWPGCCWSCLNGEGLRRSFMFYHQWAGALLNSQPQSPEYASRCQGRGSRQTKIWDPPLIIFLNLSALFSIRIPDPGVVFLFVNPQQMSLLSIWLIFYWIHINLLWTQYPLARHFAELLPTARKPSPFVSIKFLYFIWCVIIFVMENNEEPSHHCPLHSQFYTTWVILSPCPDIWCYEVTGEISSICLLGTGLSQLWMLIQESVCQESCIAAQLLLGISHQVNSLVIMFLQFMQN